MNKLFSAGCFITASGLPFFACAATDIPAIVVSATRSVQSTLTTPASITIITRKQIENSGASNVVDVLRGQGGVQINDLYGDGSRAMVGMRGFGETASSNTLVLVDGRRLNNPDIAPPDLNSVSLDDVERIEIVQGSAGILFGDQAVGGVINIITRKPAALSHRLKLATGSYNKVDFQAITSQALDNGLNYRVSLNLRHSDNYREHNASSYKNALGRLGYDYRNGSVFAELQYINDKLDTPGTLFADEITKNRKQSNTNFAGDFSNAITRLGRIGLKQNLDSNWSFEGELTDRKTDGLFRLSSVFGAETKNSTQDRNVKEFTPRLIGLVPALNDTLLTLGADVIRSDYHLHSRFGGQNNNQSQDSLYLQAVVPATEKLDITTGVRYARVNNDLSDTGTFALYPAGKQIDDNLTLGTLGFAYKANHNWRFLLRGDQNYRFAKVDEFLQPAFTPTFKPIVLQTQTGLSVESAVEWTQAKNSAKLTLYKLTLNHEIAYDPVNFANINLDKTERKGLISQFHWQATSRLGLSASYTYTDAYVTRGAFTGKVVPFVAKHSARLSADYALSSSWQAYGELVALSHRVFSGDFNNVLGQLPGYGLVNLKAQYNYKKFSFDVRVNNVFNKHYADVGQLGTNPVTFAPAEAFFPSPEINFLLTATWNFS